VAVVAILLVVFFVYRRRRGQREQQVRQERTRQEYGAEYEVSWRSVACRRARSSTMSGGSGSSEPSWTILVRLWTKPIQMVEEILVERKFPTDSRQAQLIHQDATGSQGGADLEEMRRAIQKYRSVYERLIER
jgi:hypothetical protein